MAQDLCGAHLPHCLPFLPTFFTVLMTRIESGTGCSRINEAAVTRPTYITLRGAAAARFITTAFASVVSTSAQTPEFTSKNVTLMMTYAAGGPGDTMTRIIGQGMGKVLGKQF